MTDLDPTVLAALRSIYQGMGDFADKENARELTAAYGGPPAPFGDAAADIMPVPGAVGDENIPEQGVEKGLENTELDAVTLERLLQNKK